MTPQWIRNRLLELPAELAEAAGRIEEKEAQIEEGQASVAQAVKQLAYLQADLRSEERHLQLLRDELQALAAVAVLEPERGTDVS